MKKEEIDLVLDFMKESYFSVKTYNNWNEIIPVAEKINSLRNEFYGVFYSIDSASWFFKSYISNDCECYCANSSDFIENNFIAIIEFIKYYNNFVEKNHGKIMQLELSK